jgi:hypothetical protein
MSWYDELEPAKAPAAPRPSWNDDLGPYAGQAIGAGKGPPVGVIEEPDRMAGAGKQAIASLPTDLDARVRYFAKARGIPVDRYGLMNDRIYYIGDDGQPYFEEASGRLPHSLPEIPDALKQNGKAAASLAGPSMSFIGGTAGGIAGMTTGSPGIAVTGATVGGAVGDAARQGLAHVLTDEQKPWGERAWQTAKAAGEEGFGQLAGNKFVQWMGRFGKTPTYNIPETTRLRELSQKYNVRLTPGEETGNRTLIRKQKILANTTEGEEPFTRYYEGRNEEVGAAVDNMLNMLSRKTSPRMAAQSGVEGAQAARSAVQQEVRDVARPHYRAAIDENPQRFWSEEAEALFTRPSMQDAIGAAKKLAAEEGRTLTVPTFENGKRVGDEIVPDWRSWDYMKKALDGIIEANTDATTGRVTQYGRSVIQTQKELLGILDNANPAYARARGTFANEVPLRDAVEKGIVGDAARLEGPDVVKAAKGIFTSSPEDIRLARAAFEKAGKLQNWDDLGRAYLQQQFETIKDSAVGSITNLGGAYRKKLLGSQAQREELEAAFEHNPGFWNDFQELMTVLDATGRAMKGESITAFAQAGQRELAEEARGLGPRIVDTIAIWKTPERIANYWASLQSGKYNARMAELLTTPEGRQKLRELRQLGPQSAAGVVTLSHFLTDLGAGKTGDFLTPDRNEPAKPAPFGPRLQSLPRPPRELVGRP